MSFRLPFILALLVLLSACQTLQTSRDFDPNRDFAAYQTWSWREPAFTYTPRDPRVQSDLTEQRLRDAINQQLLQRGLRPARDGLPADLEVQVSLVVEARQQQVSTSYGGYWSGYWGPYWGGPGFSETRTISYKLGTLQIDMFDRKDGKLVWRGSADQILDEEPQTPAERSARIHEVVRQILAQYPPH